MTPLGPDRVMIEFRGLGLKRDSEEEQAQRVRDHNTIWGPFGRNLHEDLWESPARGSACGRDRHRGASCMAGARTTQFTTKSACDISMSSGQGGWGDRRPIRGMARWSPPNSPAVATSAVRHQPQDREVDHEYRGTERIQIGGAIDPGRDLSRLSAVGRLKSLQNGSVSAHPTSAIASRHTAPRSASR